MQRAGRLLDDSRRVLREKDDAVRKAHGLALHDSQGQQAQASFGEPKAFDLARLVRKHVSAHRDRRTKSADAAGIRVQQDATAVLLRFERQSAVLPPYLVKQRAFELGRTVLDQPRQIRQSGEQRRVGPHVHFFDSVRERRAVSDDAEQMRLRASGAVARRVDAD